MDPRVGNLKGKKTSNGFATDTHMYCNWVVNIHLLDSYPDGSRAMAPDDAIILHPAGIEGSIMCVSRSNCGTVNIVKGSREKWTYNRIKIK
jgi:hypothetical protein